MFRIAPECYVLYLGSTGAEFRPFVRIGTAPSLPTEVADAILTVVVTDSLTGNPLHEAANLNTKSPVAIRYVGDPKMVDHFRDFVSRVRINPTGFEYHYSEDVVGDRTIVYFYDDHNVRLVRGKTELFHLSRVESRDQHFVDRARKAKNHFLRDPFRWPEEVYRTPGFSRFGQSILLHGQGFLHAISIGERFFFDVAAGGLDPDRLRTAFIGEATDIAVNLLKRAMQRTTPLTIVARRPKQELGFLFSDAADMPDGLAVVGEEAVRTLGSYTLARSPGGISLSGSGIPNRLVFGRPEAGAADLSVTEEGIVLGKTRFSLLEGVPHQIEPGDVRVAELLEETVLATQQAIRDRLSPVEQNLLDQFAAVARALVRGGGDQRSVRALRQSWRGVEAKAAGPFRVAAFNAKQLSLYAASRPKASAHWGSIASAVGGTQPTDSEIEAMPLRATLVMSGEIPHLFYRVHSAYAGAGDRDRSVALRSTIRSLAVAADADYAANLVALRRKIDECSRARRGVPEPEPVRKPVATPAPRPAPKPAATRSVSDTTAKPTEEAGGATTESTATPSTVRTRSSGGPANSPASRRKGTQVGRSRGPVVIAAILGAAALGGLGFVAVSSGWFRGLLQSDDAAETAETDVLGDDESVRGPLPRPGGSVGQPGGDQTDTPEVGGSGDSDVSTELAPDMADTEVGGSGDSDVSPDLAPEMGGARAAERDSDPQPVDPQQGQPGDGRPAGTSPLSEPTGAVDDGPAGNDPAPGNEARGDGAVAPSSDPQSGFDQIASTDGPESTSTTRPSGGGGSGGVSGDDRRSPDERTADGVSGDDRQPPGEANADSSPARGAVADGDRVAGDDSAPPRAPEGSVANPASSGGDATGARPDPTASEPLAPSAGGSVATDDAQPATGGGRPAEPASQADRSSSSTDTVGAAGIPDAGSGAPQANGEQSSGEPPADGRRGSDPGDIAPAALPDGDAPGEDQRVAQTTGTARPGDGDAATMSADEPAPTNADSAAGANEEVASPSPPSSAAGAPTATEQDGAAQRLGTDGPLGRVFDDPDGVVSGAVPISVSIDDTIRVTNRIALLNGYRPLGSAPDERKDPDRIYPGKVLRMPDGDIRRIENLDTMWDLAELYIRENVAATARRLSELLAELDAGRRTPAAVVDEVERLREEVLSTRFGNEIDRILMQLRLRSR